MAFVLHHGTGNDGEVGVQAGLETLGFKVRRSNMRAVLQSLNRPSLIGYGRITRRIYSVPWVNSLWHIDGHHKLNPWGIVIHGGIDGFSRMNVFMVASNNNRADTMHMAFRGGVDKYGWPSRVRGDRGQENRDVRISMESRYGMSSLVVTH